MKPSLRTICLFLAASLAPLAQAHAQQHAMLTVHCLATYRGHPAPPVEHFYFVDLDGKRFCDLLCDRVFAATTADDRTLVLEWSSFDTGDISAYFERRLTIDRHSGALTGTEVFGGTFRSGGDVTGQCTFQRWVPAPIARTLLTEKPSRRPAGSPR